MTARDLGEAGIKLIGFYFGVSGLIGIFRVIAAFASPSLDGLPDSATFAWLNALPVIGALVVAAICLSEGESLARRLFPAPREAVASGENLTRRDALAIGLTVLGVSIVAGALPDIVQFAGRGVWYAEASRQSQLPALLGEWREGLAESGLRLVIGAVLAIKASQLASVLQRDPFP